MFKNAYTATALCAVLFGCGGAEPQATPELGPANVLLASCPQVSTLRPRYWARQGQSLDGLTGQSFTVSSARFGCHAVEGLGVQATKLQGTVHKITTV